MLGALVDKVPTQVGKRNDRRGIFQFIPPACSESLVLWRRALRGRFLPPILQLLSHCVKTCMTLRKWRCWNGLRPLSGLTFTVEPNYRLLPAFPQCCCVGQSRQAILASRIRARIPRENEQGRTNPDNANTAPRPAETPGSRFVNPIRNAAAEKRAPLIGKPDARVSKIQKMWRDVVYVVSVWRRE
jgi:hypothetical protein